MKRRCQNQLQLQAVVMSDFDVYQLVRVIVVALRPTRLFHGLQNAGNRSVSEVREWYCSQACDGWLDHLVKTGSCLSDTEVLEEVGLWVPGMQRFDSGGMSSQDNEHPWRSHQDWLADHLGGLVAAVLHRRLLSVFWHTNQLLGKLAGLLDDRHRQGVLDWIRSADEAWRVAEGRPGQWWTLAKKRSSWNHLVVIKALRGRPRSVMWHRLSASRGMGRRIT